MGRTGRERTRIDALRSNISSVEKSKKEYSNYIQRLKQGYSAGKISYSRYVEILHEKRNGRNINEWIEHLDKHEKECRKEIQNQKKSQAKKRFALIFFSLAIISVLFFILSNLNPNLNFTGFAIQGNFSETTTTNTDVGTVNTIQYESVLNQPVKWKKEFVSDSSGEIKINIPNQAEKISVLKENSDNSYSEIEGVQQTGTSPSQESPQSETSPITGAVTSSGNQKGFFSKIIGRITGNVVSEQATEEKEITFNATEKTNYQVEYETPAPTSIEKETSTGKIIKISGSDEVHYKNVLAFTALVKEVPKGKIKLYRTTNGIKEPVEITNYIDENQNGLIERVEWIVSQLSEQTFEIIIEVSKAEHLDENKNFISDIYEQVRKLDDVWSEEISNNEYVRITFNEKLDSSKDITIFPRIVSGDPIIEVYEAGSNEKIAEFRNLAEEQYNKVLLTNLKNNQDTFELKVVGGSVEFDYIVDPAGRVVKVYYLQKNTANVRSLTNVVPAGTNIRQDVINSNKTGNVTTVNWTLGTPYTMETNLTAPINITIFCNRTLVGNGTANITIVRLLDCGTSSTCGSSTVICSASSFNPSGGIQGLCNGTTPAQKARNNFTAVCNLANPVKMHIGDYIGLSVSTYVRNISTRFNMTINYNATIVPSRINVTEITYPPFVNITYPINSTNWSNNLLDINYSIAINKTTLSCMYTNDTNLVNISLGLACSNVTTVTWSEGLHNVTVYANDTAGDLNWSKIFFMIDTIKPAINIIFPTNNTNWSNVNLDINFTRSDTGIGLKNCWYSNDTYLANSTPDATCNNVTAVVWTQGKHNVTVWANDSVGNYNFSTISFTIDTIKPQINITYPINNSVISDVNADVNYTRSEENLLITCWYSNDSYLVNSTPDTTCANITAIVWALGVHNITVWANDSAGNLNWSIRNFTVAAAGDSVKPDINITYPINNTNWTVNNINVNYTRSDDQALFNCWYSNDTYLTNSTPDVNCNNITAVTWSEGKHNVTIWANDTSHNINWSSISFTIDTVQPAIKIIYPTANNTNTSITNLNINYTRSDINGLTNCWYSNDTYLANSTPDTTCNNITTVVWTEGKHNVTVWANDTYGNYNFSTISFTIDATKPAVSITAPANNSNWTINTLDINYTRSDEVSGLKNCWYSNDTYLANSTPDSTCNNVTAVIWSEGKHNVTVWANDSAGNYNFSTRSFTIDTTKPAVNIIYPALNNTNYSNTGLDVNFTRSDASGLTNCWYSNDTYLVNLTLGTTCDNITSVVWSEAKHNVTIWANDTYGNYNFTTISFTIDATKPAVSILFPTNNSNWSNVNLDVNFTRSDDGGSGLFTCWYSNDTYLANSTADATCNNITAVVWSNAKSHNVTVWVNDSAGNYNFSTISFVIDTVKPDVNITFPINNSVISDTEADVNYTKSDSGSGIETCWYSNDSYLVNISLASCINVTSIIWTTGVHNVTVWVNDTSNNLNWSTVNFSIATPDAVKPDINITYPINNTNWSNVNLDVNYTRSDNTALFNCWYSNDTYLANSTPDATCANITSVVWTEAKHNVTIWANDTYGNYNFSTISFTIDTIKPAVSITAPVNNTNWSDVNFDINFTRSDAGSGLFNCWYSNDTYLANSTPDSSCTNITSVVWTEAKHNVTIWVNDSAGNYNFSTISFTIDTIKPDVNITFPINNSVLSDIEADVNYTRSDAGSGLFNCWYSNDSYLVNSTPDSSCANITAITWAAGVHNVTIWANDSANNLNWSTVNFTISANNPPEVRTIYNTTASIIAVATTLNAGPNPTSIIINFSAYDSNNDFNDATATINVSFGTGTQSRINSTCYKYESATNLANYTCNVTMWWFDSAGTWSINASISDLQSNSASNKSSNFSVGATTGFNIGPANLTWLTIGAGASNQTPSNHPLVLNNTGNQEIGILTGNISISATDLKGETDNTKSLFSGNFSVSWKTGGASCSGAACLECAGDQMNKTSGNYANITGANLTRGNFTINNGNTGQEQLYVCLRYAGTELTEQPYSTQSQGVWTIKILLVAFVPALKKKRKKKSIKNDKLLEAFNLIAEELKQEYSLNKKELLQVIIGKLKDNYKISRKEIIETISKEEIEIPVSIFKKEIGALESVTKYMKENLNMNYSEIARELGRDERTIWTSYKKAKEKQKETIKIDEETTFMPISIFNNKKLTILESIILYLKEKGMKYSEIGELLNRDQRNIWTIYSRAVKK